MNAKIKKYLEETMVRVEGGEFMMGEGEEGHQVILDDFSINKYPVTQELYKWVMGKNPSSFRGNQRPVEWVNWYDAIEFCNMLSKELGVEAYYKITEKWKVVINENSRGYRLPTEAEWEYAARGGKYWQNSFKYAGSDDLKKVGWYEENSHGESKEVGLQGTNQLGLYDMSGNVREWCYDWYGDYKEGAVKNPRRIENGDDRVIRGGSFSSNDYYSHITSRFSSYRDFRRNDFGFRLSKDV